MVPTNTLAAFRGPPTLSGILCPTSTIRGERAGGVGLSMLQQEVNRGAKHVGAGRSGSLTSVLLTAAILFSLNPFGGPVVSGTLSLFFVSSSVRPHPFIRRGAFLDLSAHEVIPSPVCKLPT